MGNLRKRSLRLWGRAVVKLCLTLQAGWKYKGSLDQPLLPGLFQADCRSRCSEKKVLYLKVLYFFHFRRGTVLIKSF